MQGTARRTNSGDSAPLRQLARGRDVAGMRDRLRLKRVELGRAEMAQEVIRTNELQIELGVSPHRYR